MEYYIEEDSVKMKGGVFWRKRVTIPNPKITNIDITQGPFERFLKLGTIHVQKAGAGGQQGQKSELRISGVRDLDKIRDSIIENVNASKAKGKPRDSISGTVEIGNQSLNATTSMANEKEAVLLEMLEVLKSIDEKLKK